MDTLVDNSGNVLPQVNIPDPCSLEPGATVVHRGSATSCTASATESATIAVKRSVNEREEMTHGEGASSTVQFATATEASPVKRSAAASNLCGKNLKYHDSLILWNGIPQRTDTSGKSFDWPYLNEFAAVANAIMASVKVVRTSAGDVDALNSE